ncbi:LysR family transcriptional regulator [Paraburkholderia ginsengiterrae]|uniref:LysR family transcriptional regulator n=1 Tax=Paraburkholderia ginsengiterrae TaxID=1462993 RepID=A0A1A9N721_9BURK|nr:LysR family transcriptional regulator [Paraburkholderia ginsengiterrae]OAJ55026.1 LysR family transcriptional regulator [Paraburkholderia ginsengiterrae]OAJ61208.1 LysR family transcriptional regulator [Paraburkholderia ginsengiterrae]
MRKNLDYGLLHAMTAFVRVVDAGSFTAASELMELTTAQVSRLVSELENRLQTKLLQRTTRRMALTSAGERYVSQCRTILELVDEAEGEASGARIQPTGRLRVLCMASFGDRYVVPIVAKYCAMYPAVTVEYSASQYVPDLLAEGVDVSVYLAQRLPDSSVVAQRLGAVHGVLCAAPAYLKRHGSPKTWQELADHACLRLVNPSTTPHWELTDGKMTHSMQPAGPLVGDHPEAVLHAACSGLGIALLPVFSVLDRIRSGELVQVLPQWRSPDVGVYVLMPSRKFLEAKTRAWIDLLKAELPPALEHDAMQIRQDEKPKRRRPRPASSAR